MDGPSERPIVEILLVACEWSRVGTNPAHAMAGPHCWLVTDLLKVPYYLSRGWQIVAVDPVSEAAWHEWRAAHPWAS
jgi:hypothetical protein